MTDTTTSQNIDLLSWDTLYTKLRPFCGVLEHNNCQLDVSVDASFVCDNAASLRDTIKGTLTFVPIQTYMHHKIYEAYSADKCTASRSI